MWGIIFIFSVNFSKRPERKYFSFMPEFLARQTGALLEGRSLAILLKGCYVTFAPIPELA